MESFVEEASFGWLPWLSKEYWMVPARGGMIAHTYWWPAFASFIAYPPAIWLLQEYMKHREPMKLKMSSFFWNMTLSVLSLIGSLLMLWEGHWRHIFVDEATYGPYTRAVTAIFAVTKGLEFGDTVFLVLRKRPVIFLHWYHHVSVAIYSWHAIWCVCPFAHNCAFVNLNIHAVMYCYYGLGVILPRHPVLRALRPYITMSQTLQMFVGMFLSWQGACNPSLDPEQSFNSWSALLMYTSYAYLFAAFYIKNYVKGIKVGMSLYMGTIHFLAAIGFAILWRHPNWRYILFEVACGYALTAFFLWATRSSSPFTTQQSSSHLKSTDPVKEHERLLVVQHGFAGKSIVDSLGRVLLMLLNCVCVWAREHQLLRRRSDAAKQLHEDQKAAAASTKSGKSSLVYALLEVTPSNARKSTAVSPEPTKMVNKSLNKPETPTPGATTTAPTLHSGAETVVMPPLVMPPPPPDSWLGRIAELGWEAHPIEKWLTLMCVSLPAIYGLKMYGDLYLGFCIHGCLRWVLELHTTGTLVQEMGAAKFGSSKQD